MNISPRKFSPNFQVASRRNCDFDPVAVLMWSSFLELAGAPWQGWAQGWAPSPSDQRGGPMPPGKNHSWLVENGPF